MKRRLLAAAMAMAFCIGIYFAWGGVRFGGRTVEQVSAGTDFYLPAQEQYPTSQPRMESGEAAKTSVPAPANVSCVHAPVGERDPERSQAAGCASLSIEEGDIHPNIEITPFARLHFEGAVVGTARGELTGIVLLGGYQAATGVPVRLEWIPSRNTFLTHLVAHTQTDSAGRFRFDRVIFGHIQLWSGGTHRIAYVVSVEKRGYAEYFSSRLSGSESKMVVNLEWECPLYGCIVRDGDSRPVPGASVVLEQEQAEPYHRTKSATSDEAGRFEIHGLGAGRYRLTRVHCGPNEAVTFKPRSISLTQNRLDWLVVRIN